MSDDFTTKYAAKIAKQNSGGIGEFDVDDVLVKSTERFLPPIVFAGCAYGTTAEESDIMTIALAINPNAIFDAHPSQDQLAKQQALKAVAKRVRDTLVRHGRLR